jgi:hypothetical protein
MNYFQEHIQTSAEGRWRRRQKHHLSVFDPNYVRCFSVYLFIPYNYRNVITFLHRLWKKGLLDNGEYFVLVLELADDYDTSESQHFMKFGKFILSASLTPPRPQGGGFAKDFTRVLLLLYRYTIRFLRAFTKESVNCTYLSVPVQ